MSPTPSPDLSNQELEYQEVKTRAGRGVVALISRTFTIQIISFLATFALTVFLDPSVYGVFFLVSAVVNFLAYFSDIGLAAALVQKKTAVTREDLVTTFTIQQLLVLLLLVLLFGTTPLIRASYHLTSEGVFLLWSLGISLFLSSLKTIPSVLLEREIQFNKLIIPQIGETLVFNFVAVFFAWRGWGITTFTLAVLARGVAGLVLMYLIAPWRIGLGISRASLRHLLKFGLPYQANTFLAVFKDDGMTIFLGKLIGSQGLGYLGWASRWASLPLRIFMDNITKVTFPAFSRLQHQKDKLTTSLELTLKYLTLATFPILVGMAFLAEPFVNLIPRYTKWLPALIPLYFYLYNSAWASVSTALTNTLNALGKIKTTFKLMIMWTSLTWIFMPVLAYTKGFLGVSLAVGIIATSSVVTIIAVYRHLAFSLASAFRTPLTASFFLALFLLLIRPLVVSLPLLFIFSVLGAGFYFGLIFFLEGKDFFTRTFKFFRPAHA